MICQARGCGKSCTMRKSDGVWVCECGWTENDPWYSGPVDLEHVGAWKVRDKLFLERDDALEHSLREKLNGLMRAGRSDVGREFDFEDMIQRIIWKRRELFELLRRYQ